MTIQRRNSQDGFGQSHVPLISYSYPPDNAEIRNFALRLKLSFKRPLLTSEISSGSLSTCKPNAFAKFLRMMVIAAPLSIRKLASLTLPFPALTVTRMVHRMCVMDLGRNWRRRVGMDSKDNGPPFLLHLFLGPAFVTLVATENTRVAEAKVPHNRQSFCWEEIHECGTVKHLVG